MKIEIKVYDGFEVPEGWELTGELRKPHPGEYVLIFVEVRNDGAVITQVRAAYSHNWLSELPQFIVRKKRWRAEKGYNYSWLDLSTPNLEDVIQRHADNRKVCDDFRHEQGNYFETYEDAKHALNETRKLWLSLHYEKKPDEIQD